MPTQVLRQLRPNSDVVAELAAPSPGCRTRFVAADLAADVADVNAIGPSTTSAS